MNGNQRVAQFIQDTTWDDLPGDVQAKIKQCVLDALGATLSGTLTRVNEIAAQFAERQFAGDEATVLLRRQRATAAGAAFANASAANGFDSDDGAKYTKGHPGAQLLPVTLAMSEKLGKSGREMMTAMVIGYEVAMRTARCWHDHHAIYQACGSWGAVANAAATAHLMGLGWEQIQHALGIAEYHAPNLPMMRDIDDPAMVKHGIGWGSITGIMAAELAALGYTGIPSILGMERYEDWVADIGQEYLTVEGVTFKEFACCGWSHAPILGARKLLQAHDFAVDEIERVRVEGFHETIRLGDRLPATTEEAQFNTAWPLAAFMLHGEVGPAQTLEERLGDARTQALANKIQLVENERFTELADRKRVGDPEGSYSSRVEITLQDGTRYDSGVVSFSHDYGVNWSDAQVATKFRWLVGQVLPEERVEALIGQVWELDRLTTMEPLIALVE